MQYKTRYALRTREGEERVVRKFLLLPRSFDTAATGRWLCYADVIERVCLVVKGHVAGNPYRAWEWSEVGFADERTGTPPKNREELLREKSDLLYALESLTQMTDTLVETTRKRGRLTLYANNDKFADLADEVQSAQHTLETYSEENPDA